MSSEPTGRSMTCPECGGRGKLEKVTADEYWPDQSGGSYLKEKGGSKYIARCSTCDGVGRVIHTVSVKPAYQESCSGCSGKGTITTEVATEWYPSGRVAKTSWQEKTCSKCLGTGLGKKVPEERLNHYKPDYNARR